MISASDGSSPIDGFEHRHAGTRHVLQWFVFDHLDGGGRSVSREFYTLARKMVGDLPDGPELTTMLRKLLEAKDCAVRCAALAKRQADVDAEMSRCVASIESVPDVVNILQKADRALDMITEECGERPGSASAMRQGNRD